MASNGGTQAAEPLNWARRFAVSCDMTKIKALVSAVIVLAFVLFPTTAYAQHWLVETHVPCSTATTVVWLDQLPGGGTAGSTYYGLEFTNYSNHACNPSGFAGVSAVNLHGQQIGSPAVWEGSSEGFSLAPGQTATALIQITDSGNYGPTQCGYANAAGLRVYPPNQYHSKVVPFPFRACSNASVSLLHEQALQPGLHD